MSKQSRIIPSPQFSAPLDNIPDHLTLLHEDSDLSTGSVRGQVDRIYKGWGLILSQDRSSDFNDQSPLLKHGLNIRGVHGEGEIRDRLRIDLYCHMLYPLEAPQVIRPERLFEHMSDIPDQYYE